MSTTLPRINVEQQITSELAQQRKKLLTDAATKLNYKLANPKTLLHQLVSIGIVPFKTSAVEAYMKSKEKKGMSSDSRNLLIWTFINLLIAGACPVMVHFYKWESFSYFVLFVFEALSFLTAFSIFEPKMGSVTSWKWSRDYLQHYSGSIPDHVLNTALRVKEVVPHASFEIYHLEKSTDYLAPVRDPDPFLRVTDNNEQYFIEQWDERDQPRYDE